MEIIHFTCSQDKEAHTRMAATLQIQGDYLHKGGSARSSASVTAFIKRLYTVPFLGHLSPWQPAHNLPPTMLNGCRIMGRGSVDAVEAAKQEVEWERGRAAAADRLAERPDGDGNCPSWRANKVLRAWTR